jgi:hypothetical protein
MRQTLQVRRMQRTLGRLQAHLGLITHAHAVLTTFVQAHSGLTTCVAGEVELDLDLRISCYWKHACHVNTARELLSGCATYQSDDRFTVRCTCRA